MTTSQNDRLAAAIEAAKDNAPRRFVITGGPSAGKDDVIAELIRHNIPCMETEPGRAIYRKHRQRLGRHLRTEDRREYAAEVLDAFIAEYEAQKSGFRFYNRGIPDSYGWERFFGLSPSAELEEANRIYRYDTVFVLDPLDSFEDPDDIVWAKEREIRRVHELIVQGYYDAGYEPTFVPAESAEHRVDFILTNVRIPKPQR